MTDREYQRERTGMSGRFRRRGCAAEGRGLGDPQGDPRDDYQNARRGRFGQHDGDGWEDLRGGRLFTPRTLYRARDGKLMGVCKGLAEYFGMSVFWVRVLFVAAALFTGFWPVLGLYVLAGLVMKPRPALAPADAGERDFYGRYVSSRAEALRRLKDKFDRLEGRIRRMEDVVTRRDFDWDRRFGAQR